MAAFGAVDLFSGSSSITGSNLWQTDKDPLNQLDEGIEDVIGKQGQNTGNSIWTAIANLIDSLLGITPSSGTTTSSTSTYQDIIDFVNNLLAMLGLSNTSGGSNDPTSGAWSLTSLIDWVEQLLWPTNSVAPITSDGSSGGVTGFVPLENLLLSAIGDVIGGSQGLIDAILSIVGFAPGSGTEADVNAFFTDVYQWLGQPALTSSAFNAATAVQNWVNSLLPGLDATQITSGQFPQNMVVGLTTDLANLEAGLAAGNAQQVIDAILETVGIPAGSGTETEVNSYFSDLMSMFNNPNLTATNFHPVTALEDWIISLVQPTNLLAPMNPTTQLVSTTNIPGLDASKIVSGLFPQWLMPLVPVGSVGQTTPNLLANPNFNTAASTDAANFTYDASNSHTSDGSGSIRTTCAGTTKDAVSDPPIPVSAGQQLACSVWTSWSGVTGAGGCFALTVRAYLSGNLVGSTMLATVSNPAASSTWTQLSGTYTTPQTGVDSIRLDLQVLPGATAGTVWFDDASVTKVQLFSETWTAGLTGDINNLTTGVDARALQTDVISLVNALGTGSYSSIPASLADIGTRLQNLLVQGTFDAEQLFNIPNMPMLSIGSIPTTDLGVSNIADLGGLTDYVTNALIGLVDAFVGTTPAQANSSMQSLYGNMLNNTQSIQALQSTNTATDNSGVTVTVDFANYPNGPLPSTFTTTYSYPSGGSGSSLLGVSNGVSGWFPLNNDGPRRAICVYNVEATNTDFQIVRGAMAAAPGGQSQSGYPMIYAIGRVDNPVNPQNYVWARAYSTGFLTYKCDVGCTIAGVDTVFPGGSGIPLTWSTNIAFVVGANGNPRQYQVFSGTQLVKTVTEAGTTSQYGPGYRYWGARTEMQYDPTFGAGNPGTIAGTSVSDNAPPQVQGSTLRVYRASTTPVNIPSGAAQLAANFFDTSGDPNSPVSTDLTWLGSNNSVTVSVEGTYLINLRYALNFTGEGVRLDALLYLKRGGATQLIRRGGAAFSDSYLGASPDGLAATFLVYLLAGDTIMPGTAASVAINNGLVGENTSTQCWMEVALTNHSYA